MLLLVLVVGGEKDSIALILRFLAQQTCETIGIGKVFQCANVAVELQPLPPTILCMNAKEGCVMVIIRNRYLSQIIRGSLKALISIY